MYCNFDNMLQNPPPLRLNSNPDDFKGTYQWFNFYLKCCKLANNWFYLWFLPVFPLCRALETGFNLHFCLKLFESNCTSLSWLKRKKKRGKNVKNCFIPYSLFTYLMKRTSLGQLPLQITPYFFEMQFLLYFLEFWCVWSTFVKFHLSTRFKSREILL